MKLDIYELALAELQGDEAATETLTQHARDWAEALGQIKHAAEEEIIARRAEAATMEPPRRFDDNDPYTLAYRARRREYQRWYNRQVLYLRQIESRCQHAKSLFARERQQQQRERSKLRIEQRLWRVEELLGISEHQEWMTYHERLLRVERLLEERSQNTAALDTTNALTFAVPGATATAAYPMGTEWTMATLTTGKHD